MQDLPTSVISKNDTGVADQDVLEQVVIVIADHYSLFY